MVKWSWVWYMLCYSIPFCLGQNIRSVCAYAFVCSPGLFCMSTFRMCASSRKCSNIFTIQYVECVRNATQNENARLIKDLLWIVYALAISTKICDWCLWYLKEIESDSEMPSLWKTDFVFILNSLDLGFISICSYKVLYEHNTHKHTDKYLEYP